MTASPLVYRNRLPFWVYALIVVLIGVAVWAIWFRTPPAPALTLAQKVAISCDRNPAPDSVTVDGATYPCYTAPVVPATPVPVAPTAAPALAEPTTVPAAAPTAVPVAPTAAPAQANPIWDGKDPQGNTAGDIADKLGIPVNRVQRLQTNPADNATVQPAWKVLAARDESEKFKFPLGVFTAGNVNLWDGEAAWTSIAGEQPTVDKGEKPYSSGLTFGEATIWWK
ncbi:MAG: hypothetical protein WC841_04760 [Candidatus Shapirobacteria bacterium]|jgi:hypothetical protein